MHGMYEWASVPAEAAKEMRDQLVALLDACDLRNSVVDERLLAMIGYDVNQGARKAMAMMTMIMDDDMIAVVATLIQGAIARELTIRSEIRQTAAGN